MILTDTGPIVAILNTADQHHAVCVAMLRRIPDVQLLTTWPCFTEAMHFLGRVGGYRYQARLWDLYSAGKLFLHPLTPAETARMAELMERYRDAPMDLADASLVVAAESLALRRVFTVDHHFYIYRLSDGSALEVIPGGGE